MNEFKRITRIPTVSMLLVAILIINIGIYLYELFPNMDVMSKYKEVAAFKQIQQEHQDQPFPASELIEAKRLEATAYAVLQDPNSSLHDVYKELFPSVWNRVSQGSVMKDASFYESAYILFQKQLKYFEEYATRILRMESEYKQKSNSSVFRNQKNTLMNMEKTLIDFSATSQIKLSLGDDRAITSLIDSPFTDLLLFAYLWLISLSFIYERKTGLWEIVYSTKGGRKSLCVQRAFCLFLFTFLAAIVLFVPKFLMSFSIYNGYEQFNRSIQSISIFSKFLMPLNIQQFLIFYFFLKLISTYFVALFIWAMMSSHSNANIATLCVLAVAFVEYLLYSLPESSFFIIAKYINLFSYIFPIHLVKGYYNILFFDTLQNISLLSVYLIPILIAMNLTILIHFLSKKRPESKGLFSAKLIGLFPRFHTRITPYVPALIREFHKKIIMEKWLLPFCLLIYLICSYNAPQSILSNEDVYKQFYYQQFFHEDSKDIEHALKTEKQMLNEQIVVSKKNLTSESADKQFGALMQLEQLINRQNAIDSIADEVQDIELFNKSHHIKVAIVDPYFVEALLGVSGNNYQKARASLIIFFLAVLSATFVPFERQENVLPIIRSTCGGMSMLWKRRIVVHLLFFLTVFLGMYGPEIMALLSQRYISFESAIQSIPSFRNSSNNLSLSIFCLFLYGYRFFISLGFSFLCIYVSSFTKSIYKSTLLLISTIVIPNLVLAFMSKQLNSYAPIHSFAAVRLFSDNTDGILLAYPILYTLSIFACWKRLRKLS